MNEKEYQEFVTYLYHEYMENKFNQILRRHLFEFRGEGLYLLSRLTKAMRALRFIEHYFDEEEELSRSLTPEMLDDILNPVEHAVQHNNRLTVQTEIADVIQDHFAEIIDGMKIDYFPEQDFEILRQSGSLDPRREVTAIINLLKSRKEQLLRDGREIQFSQSLERTVKLIAQRRKLLEEEPEKKTQQMVVKRRWFKGIGRVCQGTLLSLTDISVAAGVWGASLPIEMRTVGTVVSATSGIGMILTGVGEFRGE